MVDIWYPCKRGKINGMDCFFYGEECQYRGNLFVDGVPVGDYASKDSHAVEKIARSFGIPWSWGN